MKNIFKYMAGMLIAGFAMTACSPEEFTGANGDIPIASSYESAIEILVDQETNQVTFNLNSKGCMPVWIFDGKNYSTVNGMQKIYTLAGDYTVDIRIANANGLSDGVITKTFHLDNSIVDFTRYITFLAGDESKEWWINKDQPGHLGCGEPGSDGLGWWSAAANEKADAGLYDDIVTFDKNKNYTYNPGEGGTVYVNKGVSYFSEFNPKDDNDFMAQVSEQKTTYDFTVEGTDLYVTFPSKTLFPYIATDQSYDNPRYKVLSMNTKTMELVSDYGDIAWHYKLTCETKEPEEEPGDDVKWFEDAASNLWRQATYTNSFYYAPGWSPIANPEVVTDNYTYTVTLPTATTDQWQAQVVFNTDMSTVSSTNYDFRCILNSSQDINGVTVKLVLKGDDNTFYFAERVNLKAYEDYIFKMVDMPGIDMDFVNLVFDFGGNPANTEVTISGIVLQEHGTGKVTWLPDSDCNMWKSMSYTNFFYYAPGWAPIASPELTANGNNYTIGLGTATTDQWQAQVGFMTDMTTNAATNYDFHCILNANQNLNGVTVKLVLEGDDNVFYFAERVNLSAYEDYTFEQVSMPGIDMSKVNLIFDFGGNPAGTEVVISNVILKESGCTN